MTQHTYHNGKHHAGEDSTPALTAVSETLYVPLLGRIYASNHHPSILYDTMALSIWDRLPETIREMRGQTEYTLLASAARSKNIDYYIQNFVSNYPSGVIINVGCGLETAYHRNSSGDSKAVWFELDLPEVLTLRTQYFPEQERDRYLPFSMFDYAWIKTVKATTQGPILIVASGLFYYFKEDQVIDFIRHLTAFNHAELVFDAVSPAGLKITRHYMRKMGRGDAEMFFSVGNAKAFATRISPNTHVLGEREFYSLATTSSTMSYSTKIRMGFSDLLGMVKMFHLRIS